MRQIRYSKVPAQTIDFSQSKDHSVTLRNDAIEIWKAGVLAADSAAAVRRQVHCCGNSLTIAGRTIDLSAMGRLEVVGAGKAGAGMAAGIEQALSGTEFFERLTGWINVPEDCVRPLQKIHLHGGRPAGLNEPTQAVIQGTQEILRRVSALGPKDMCVVLLSGGGSALLCSPVPEITLEDKLSVTRLLSASGAPIHELNLVRTQLSLVKGGRLASACRAGLLVTLIVSDVIGDPLDVIGSGPTFPVHARTEAAIAVLERRGLMGRVPEKVAEFLQQPAHHGAPVTSELIHQIVASNTESLHAAAGKAQQLGYLVADPLRDIRGAASAEGQNFLKTLISLGEGALTASKATKGLCLLAGGETTVNVASAGVEAGKGGRNQEFVLAAAVANPDPAAWGRMVILSGGTDGEDGPTNAAGALCDAEIMRAIATQGLQAADALRRHDAWTFFQRVSGLLVTGPTHTNVMDLAVGLICPRQ